MNKVRAFQFAAVLVILSSAAMPAFAVSKDMVQLQTQVQQLQDAVARLQQSNDERMGVLKDLVQGSADSVNRLSTNMDALQKQLTVQQSAQGAKVDQVSGQVQALNDSIDEIKTRMSRLEKMLTDVQSQQQGMSASMQTATPSAAQPGTSQSSTSQSSASQPTTSQSSASPTSTTPSTSSRTATPSAVVFPDSTAIPASGLSARRPAKVAGTPGPAAPPADELYRSAYSDYMAARYPIASSEFEDVIKSYPDNSLSGNSFYYLGEIDFRAGKYASAAKNYDKVLEQFPDNNKIPAAHLHKGQALMALKDNDGGVRELRTLIQRFPTSPEATQARSKLSGLGIPVKPRA